MLVDAPNIGRVVIRHIERGIGTLWHDFCVRSKPGIVHGIQVHQLGLQE